jgi:hypothetical protein
MAEKFEQKGVVSRGDQVLHPELHAECERKFEQMQRDLQAKVEQQKRKMAELEEEKEDEYCQKLETIKDGMRHT